MVSVVLVTKVASSKEVDRWPSSHYEANYQTVSSVGIGNNGESLQPWVIAFTGPSPGVSFHLRLSMAQCVGVHCIL